MKPINKESVSKRIKQLRKEKNLTLEEWSALFGSNKSAGSKWENGTIPYKKTLEKMSQICDKPIEWILFGTFTEYITDFIKQFPSIYKEIMKWEGEEYFSNKAKILTEKGKTYGDDEAIILELLSDYHNRNYFIKQDEFLDYLSNFSLKLSDINPVELDNSLKENSLIYRFSLINKVNQLLLQSNRVDEIKDLEIQGFPKEIDAFSVMLEYLNSCEKLFSFSLVSMDKDSTNKAQHLKSKLKLERYFLHALVVERDVLNMMWKYHKAIEMLAEEYSIDLSDFERILSSNENIMF